MKLIVFGLMVPITFFYSKAAVANESPERNIFLAVEDQRLLELTFAVAEITNFLVPPDRDAKGLFFFLAGEKHLIDRNINLMKLNFLTEEQRTFFERYRAQAKNCFIQSNFIGGEPTLIAIANITGDSFDENRKCMILAFADYAGLSVVDLQKLSVGEIIGQYFMLIARKIDKR
ncbi:MAG: hypothetical protein ABJN11_08000 [Lentilitoribacter sp.]